MFPREPEVARKAREDPRFRARPVLVGYQLARLVDVPARPVAPASIPPEVCEQRRCLGGAGTGTGGDQRISRLPERIVRSLVAGSREGAPKPEEELGILDVIHGPILAGRIVEPGRGRICLQCERPVAGIPQRLHRRPGEPGCIAARSHG